MGSMIQKLPRGKQVICLQEVHEVEAEILLSFRRWLPGWHISTSASVLPDGSVNPASGGLVTAVSPLIKGMANFEDAELVPGRCLCTSVLLGDKVLAVINLHNYGINSQDIQSIGEYLASLRNNIRSLLVADLESSLEILILNLKKKGCFVLDEVLTV